MTQRDVVTKAALGIYLTGFVIHSIGIIVRYFEAGYIPLLNLHEGLSFLAWGIAGIFFIFYYKYKVGVLGAFVSPLSFILILSAFAFSSEIIKLAPALQSFWRPIHVTFSFLGDAMFAVAALVGVMYLLQERQLKTKKMNVLYYILPSLDVSDRINYKCLTFGFPMLTIGIITGAIWVDSAWGTYWSWDPKETWSLITWFIYAAMLHGRLTTGWRGRKVAILSIIGFLAILFTFLGVNLILGGTHAEELHFID
jgi:cytochrome c-type biogenesis protein CcsB